jgi:hypothetical protein
MVPSAGYFVALPRGGLLTLVSYGSGQAADGTDVRLVARHVVDQLIAQMVTQDRLKVRNANRLRRQSVRELNIT